MKTWQKVAIGIATAGITATAIYFTVKAVKKQMAKKDADKKTDDSKALLPSEKKAKADKLAAQIKVLADQGKDSSATPLKDELKKLGFSYDKGKAIA